MAKYMNATPTVTKIDTATAPASGAVEIASEPTAGIYVDGKRVGRTPATLKLPAKRHRIELRKPGYRTVTRDILPSSRHGS